MRRSVTDDEIETFWRDGVVCLRGVLDVDAVAAMEAPVAGLIGSPALADLSAMGDALRGGEAETSTADRGRFVSGVDHWREVEAFREFAMSSAVPQVVAQVLRTAEVRLWEDSVLVKEPHSVERTSWHQDMSYFHVDGQQVCTTWIPLDRVTAASGSVQFVVGSHQWNEVFRPNFFITDDAIPGTAGRAVPDIDAMAASGEVHVITFDTEPGDLTIHHALTVHGAGANSTDDTRRAISIRYCGDDARYLRRPGAPLKPHHHAVRDGDALADPDCPLVWDAR